MSNQNWSNSEELSDDQLENVVGGVTGAGAVIGAGTFKQKSEGDMIVSALAGLQDLIPPKNNNDANIILAYAEAKLNGDLDQDLKHHDHPGDGFDLPKQPHDDTRTKDGPALQKTFGEGPSPHK